MQKLITMIAGPNGAGKSTIASRLITPDIKIYDEFVNADLIAQGLAPLKPESVSLEAGKLMMRRFHALVEANRPFAFETTGAAITYAKHLNSARQKGYQLNLLFLWLPTADQAVQRVAARVSQGGHHIPEDVVRRRYVRGLINLINLYLPIADTALILDNSMNDEVSTSVIAEKIISDDLKIHDESIWQKILKVTHG